VKVYDLDPRGTGTIGQYEVIITLRIAPYNHAPYFIAAFDPVAIELFQVHTFFVPGFQDEDPDDEL